MATKKKTVSEPAAEAAAAPSAPMNREQRRRAKFGNAGKVHQHDPVGPWPEIGANPALLNTAADREAIAGRPDQDVTHDTGPGSGGATEQAEHRPHHEGAHPGKSTKG